MNKIKEHLQLILIIAGVIGVVLGGIKYFATAEALEKFKEEACKKTDELNATITLVANRLDQKIASDQILDLNRRIYQLEDRNKDKGPNPVNWDQRDKDEFRKIREMIERLEKERDRR